MISAGIARLQSMQTRSGGLGYWPDAAEPDLWGTTYAARFLSDAMRANHSVDRRFIDELAEYLTRMLNGADEREVSDNQRAAICRVLADFQRPQTGWMARLQERPDRLDMAGRAHLASAWYAVGRKDRALETLRDDTITQSIATTTSGRLTSQVEQEAVLLSALLEIDVNHPWIPPLVQRVVAARKDGRWGSTLQTAAAIAALCRYQLNRDEQPDFTGTLVAGADHYEFGSTGPARFTLAEAMQPLMLETEGTGTVYVCVSTTGRRLDEPIEVYDRKLTVRRDWFTPDGKPVDPQELKVGELARVQVCVAAPSIDGESVDNVAVVDVLPGGMEIDNPRLATSASSGLPESVDASEPDRVEFLDDRVVLFTSVTKAPRTFIYYLRATTVGRFTRPSIEASCMYDASFASVHGAGEIEVTP
jgi:uncharacterized protein YfaS (alpha-2-macroglobulin family)